MKKINWGTGIFLFYSFFALMLFYQVYKSTQYDRSLVIDNYYEEDLKYQQTFNKLQNALNLSVPLKFTFFKKTQLIELQFPHDKEAISGKVLLYRPSNKKLDITLPIQVNMNNVMDIPIEALQFGKWVVEVDWQSNQRSYLNRFTVEVATSS